MANMASFQLVERHQTIRGKASHLRVIYITREHSTAINIVREIREQLRGCNRRGKRDQPFERRKYIWMRVDNVRVETKRTFDIACNEVESRQKGEEMDEPTGFPNGKHTSPEPRQIGLSDEARNENINMAGANKSKKRPFATPSSPLSVHYYPLLACLKRAWWVRDNKHIPDAHYCPMD